MTERSWEKALFDKKHKIYLHFLTQEGSSKTKPNLRHLIFIHVRIHDKNLKFVVYCGRGQIET